MYISKHYSFTSIRAGLSGIFIMSITREALLQFGSYMLLEFLTPESRYSQILGQCCNRAFYYFQTKN